MYLSCVRLWNFRKFGSGAAFDIERPNLDLSLKKGLNVLVGENDSGKSAIVDAIRLVLGTHSIEYTRVVGEDFHDGTDRFRIELVFEDLIEEEAKYFVEWVSWIGEGGSKETHLRVNLDVRCNAERVFPAETRAGGDVDGLPLPAEAREYLKTTYLKPLRDAEGELVPRRNSRLSQILQGHEAFKGKEKDHALKRLYDKVNHVVEAYFDGKAGNGTELKDVLGKQLKDEIDRYMSSFRGQETKSEISAAEGTLKSILEKLELTIKDDINPGLGTLNRLFMASELVHLNKKNWHGLRLGLIEELEAHLHPQAQMQVIESLERESGIQVILTTHSPNLASKVRLDDLIVFCGGAAYPMRGEFTELEDLDRTFLEWFLDVTKSNLFFARGVIMVEGWSEGILLPALATRMKLGGIIKKDLTEAGVSIVNVGSTAFLRYAKIFWRKCGPEMPVPVAVVTDVDVPAYTKTPRLAVNGIPEKDSDGKTVNDYLPRDSSRAEAALAAAKLEKRFTNQKVKAFVSPEWTLEYCLYKSPALSSLFVTALKEAHPRVDGADIERALARKLLDGSLKKTEIAHRLALKLTDPAVDVEFGSDAGDLSVSYLLEAIRYASGHTDNG